MTGTVIPYDAICLKVKMESAELEIMRGWLDLQMKHDWT